MKKINAFFTSVIVFTLFSLSNLASADAAQDIKDARLESQIWTTYALSPYLRANDLKVTVRDGKAILTGTVDEDVNKDLAKQIAVGVKGIKEVDNQIVVQSDYNPKGTYGYGETIDDVTITATVKSRLIWSKYSYVSTTVETKSGHVSLTGSVNSQAAKDLAGRLAANTRGVISVKNALVIDDKAGPAENAKATANDASKNIADAWITTKVKSNFFYSTNVSGSNIDVTTNAGVVTLKGKVNTGAERALAIEIAENVRGVKRVEAQGLAF
ncbi:MAG: BON domain-containing protein [Pseudomonadota bacterium]